MGTSEVVSIGTLRREIRELTATVTVLLDMLAEAGALDREMLRTRVEAMLENSREETPPMSDPWRPSDPDLPPPLGGAPDRDAVHEQPMVQCASCGSMVPERMTVIIATGVICDVCASRRA